MRVSTRTPSWFAILAIVAFTGCGTSAEDVCESSCELAKRCAEDGLEPDCSEDSDEMKECVDQIEDYSASCRSALDDFIDCINDENACFADDSGLASECGSEAGDVLEECDGDIPGL